MSNPQPSPGMLGAAKAIKLRGQCKFKRAALTESEMAELIAREMAEELAHEMNARRDYEAAVKAADDLITFYEGEDGMDTLKYEDVDLPTELIGLGQTYDKARALLEKHQGD